MVIAFLLKEFMTKIFQNTLIRKKNAKKLSELTNTNTMSNEDIKVIIAPKGAKYLSEFMEDLPNNVIFNKVTTGSGMTVQP